MANGFGEILKQLRTENKLTQEDLATKLNVHKGTVSNWENNHRFPEEKILIKLADTFNCTIDYLLGRSTIRNPVEKTFYTKKEVKDLLPEQYKNLVNDLEVLELAHAIKKEDIPIEQLIEALEIVKVAREKLKKDNK